MTVLELIDGLKERGILDRLESCDVDGERVTLKLAAPTFRTADTLPPPGRAMERDEDDRDGLKYASS